LRKRYRLTEGGFRSRFRKARCQEKEPLKDFQYRLECYFDNWVKMSEVGQTYEGVKSLTVKDQLFFTVPQEVQLRVKEKGKQKLDEVVRNATNYIEAHGMDIHALGKTKEKKGDNGKKVEAGNRSRITEHLKNRHVADNGKMRSSYEIRVNEAGSKSSDSKVQCYGCGMFGHKVNSCPAKHKDV